MHDYKKLIDNLRTWAAGCDRTNRGCQVCLYLYEAADVIEQLFNDRNASVDALKSLGTTIDLEPVRHGHWVKPGGYVCGDYEFVCSVCGDCRWEGLGLPNRAHYCQCCGAKMDEVSE